MVELLTEEDFIELPEEAEHKWIHLEKIASARLSKYLDKDDTNGSKLKHQYMHVVQGLADTFGVEDVRIPSNQKIEEAFSNFLLLVSRAKTRIWANSIATYPFGRVKLTENTKSAILDLTAEIERQINSLEDSERRKAALHKKLEDFRREINQSRTRVGAALSTLAQVSTVVAMSTTSLAQGPDAYATILRLLGAAQSTETTPEIQLLETEHRLLLPSPPKQIEGPRSDGSAP